MARRETPSEPHLPGIASSDPTADVGSHTDDLALSRLRQLRRDFDDAG
jgi:hypothetical protein